MPAYRYAAFISYRHLPRDAQAAKVVQAAIEGYRIPRGAQVMDGFTAGQPLGTCFRDEDELAAAHSLPESIMEALHQSAALVVVCSPETKDSAWVQREIEAYIDIHGRERIFAVLAAGSSSESIPEILRAKTVLDINGEEQSIPTEPLAADLRAESAHKHADEKLRIVAAVAGCGFDDLRQRTRSRKRKRIAAGVMAALAIAGAIGGFAWSSHNSQQSAFIEESHTLAVQSQQLYAQGDRYGAIEAALAALPTSEADTSRPLVPEAQQALSTALQISPRLGTWVPRYMLEQNGTNMIGVNAQTKALGIVDDDTALHMYDLPTGAPLSEEDYTPAGTFEYPFGQSITELTQQLDGLDVAYSELSDMYQYDDVLYVASSDHPESDWWVSSYKWKLQAFDQDKKQLWEYEGTTKADLDLGYQTNAPLLYSGMPDIIGCEPEHSALALRFGPNLVVLDTTTQEPLYETTCSSPIVGAKWYKDSFSGHILLLLACSDGTIWEKDPFDQRYSTEGRSFVFQLPTNLMGAVFSTTDDGLYVSVAEAFDYQSAYNEMVAAGEAPPEDTNSSSYNAIEAQSIVDHNDKVYVYKYVDAAQNLNQETDTLDELIALAHETLSAAGREASANK